MSKAKDKPTIFAYGFDAAGFAVPTDPLESAKFSIRFVTYASEESLEPADGIITPSGIFETWETSNSYMGSSSWLVCTNKDHLAKREKEVFQNFKRGGWTAFLLRGVDNGDRKNWTGTDLAKRFLNPFFYDVVCHDIPILMFTAKPTNSRIISTTTESAGRHLGVQKGITNPEF
jgi:hypothetical protein